MRRAPQCGTSARQVQRLIQTPPKLCGNLSSLILGHFQSFFDGPSEIGGSV